MRFRFVEDHRAEYPVRIMCGTLDVSSAGYDNPPMESFFLTLKTERVYRRQYATHAEAQRDIFAYIEGFYN